MIAIVLDRETVMVTIMLTAMILQVIPNMTILRITIMAPYAE